jgi:outer membrane protein TolC
VDAGLTPVCPSISIPIFEGGQLKSTLELRKASEQEAAVNYQRVVLKAWHDVDNALTAYETTQRRRDELIQAAAQNQRALTLATSRYTEGVADFLQVLDAQTRLLNTQQQLAIATTNVSENLVALYKALGGGWETAYPDKQVQADAGAAKPVP